MRTLLFDFGGTLDADGVAWKERFHAYYRDAGVDLTADAFAPVFYAADDPLVGGLPQDADLADTVRRLAANLEAGMPGGPDHARGGAIAARFLDESDAAFARNRPVLGALVERFRLGIVSNFYGNLSAVCHGANMEAPFGVIVDSERVGARKPDPAIFRAALEPLDAAAETALMIGDSLHRDREGALRAGMGFVWIAPPSLQQPPAPDHPVIGSLQELADMLL